MYENDDLIQLLLSIKTSFFKGLKTQNIIFTLVPRNPERLILYYCKYFYLFYFINAQCGIKIDKVSETIIATNLNKIK